MKDKMKFKLHIISLVAMFVLGEAVVFLPTANANEFTFAAFLVSGVFLVAVFLLSSFIIDGAAKASVNDNLLKRVAFLFFFAGIAVFALFCGAKTFFIATDFISRIILSKTPKWIIVVVFGATVLYFALKQRAHLLKFSLLSAVVLLAVIIFFLIAAMDQYDVRNMYIFKIPSFRQLGTQMAQYIFNMVLPVAVLPAYLFFAFRNSRVSTGVAGAIFGVVLLGLCVLSPVLLFGSTLAGELDYPFSSAVSTVTVGRLFTRLDGFAYFVYFVCGLVKVTVCLSVAFSCLKKMSRLSGDYQG